MPLEPWNTVLNEDPRIVGNENGSRIFSVSLKNRDAPIPTLLIAANTPEEAEAIFRGDGIAKENELLCVDVTDTAEIPRAEHSGRPVFEHLAMKRIDEFTSFGRSEQERIGPFPSEPIQSEPTEDFPTTPVDSSEADPKPKPKKK
jgi:hypothetical protein